MLAFCSVCLLGAEFTWLRMLHTLINIIIKTYAISSRLQKIGTHFVDFTNIRFLYVCLIFYNVLTNFLLPIALFILWQGSVLLQCNFMYVLQTGGQTPTFLHKSLQISQLQSGTRYRGCQVRLTSNHWIKNCVSHFWLDSLLVFWPQAMAVPYSSLLGLWICKLKLANLDTGRLHTIYIYHFLYPSTHLLPLQISYGADVSDSITRISTVVPCILILLKSFIYQLMHNRVAVKEYSNLHQNSSYMFRFNHHHQGAYYLSLLKL